MPDNGRVTQQLEQPAVTGKKKRGRESVGDMVRSLSLVLLIVLVAFFLAQPPDSDEKALRQVNPATDIAAFAQAHAGVPVPSAQPAAGWRATVTDLTPDQLRVGWVTAQNEYAEYAVSTGPADEFLREITDAAPEVDPVDIGGVRWKQYRSGAAISLVRSAGGATIVVGTRRASASLEELRVLAGSLTG